MSRIYQALRRAESRRAEPPELHSAVVSDTADDATRELADDISSLAALVRRLELHLDQQLRASRQDTFEHFAALEVSIDAIEDRLDEQTDPASAVAAALEETRELLAALGARLHTLEERTTREIPNLRAELEETLDKRVQLLLGREQTTRDRIEARIDALRRDLDRGQRRHAILIGAVLLTGFVAYAC